MLRKIVLIVSILTLSGIICAAQVYDKLTPKQLADLEAKLKQKPDDLPTRRALIIFYQLKETPANKSALQRHRIALILNNPEEAVAEYFGFWSKSDKNKPDYIGLKNAWLKQIAADKDNYTIRFNAADFLVPVEEDLVEKILKEGQTTDPGNLEFYERLVKFYGDQFIYLSDNALIKNPEIQIKDTLTKIIREAKAGLAKIDNIEYAVDIERTDSGMFLSASARAYLELGDVKNAKTDAERLLLVLGKPEEFSDETDIVNFQIGMSILGRLQLREGNTARAREYLLNSIEKINSEMLTNPKIDVKFLKEFLVNNGKRVVLEYLQKYQTLNLSDEDKETIKKLESTLNKGEIPEFEEIYFPLY